ncbi:hypothetical protein BTVI_37108 [Pitangus sulphuratus]|nr:hypothetical protein BTVI_37108 [Pitangus sulphuratus]
MAHGSTTVKSARSALSVSANYQRETQSSLNVQVAARKENLTRSEEKAVTFAALFICLLHPFFSAQTCIESMQLPTLNQCLEAQQGPDITSTKITVTLGYAQLKLQHCHGLFHPAPPRHTTSHPGCFSKAVLNRVHRKGITDPLSATDEFNREDNPDLGLSSNAGNAVRKLKGTIKIPDSMLIVVISIQ